MNDAINVFNNVQCDIVGKKAFFIYFEKNKLLTFCLGKRENQFVSHVADSSLVVKRKVLEKVEFPNLQGNGTVSSFQRSCIEKGFKIYSGNRFNYVAHRHPNPNSQHTWKVEDNDLLKNCTIIKKDIDDYKPYILK